VPPPATLAKLVRGNFLFNDEFVGIKPFIFSEILEEGTTNAGGDGDSVKALL